MPDRPSAAAAENAAVMRRALAAIEQIVAFGGNGEGWTINDAALIARAALGKSLDADDIRRVRQIAGDAIADNACEVPLGAMYDD